MAKKRMFNNEVLDTDAFLEMPLSAQALYFHLNLRADDDGFISKPKKITEYVNASMDDLKLLVAKRFILTFDDGVIVIKHWRMHNTIQKDRYTPTHYQEDLALLDLKPNKSYTRIDDELFALNSDVSILETECIHNVSTDIDKDIDIDIDKDLKRKNKQKESSSLETEYLGKKSTNLFNYRYYRDNILDDTYIKENESIDKIIEEWMEYKDSKDRKNNHYDSELGIKKLVNSVIKCSKKHGIDATVECIDSAIIGLYAGMHLERLDETNNFGSKKISVTKGKYDGMKFDFE